MKLILGWIAAILFVAIAGLLGWRSMDHRADRAEMDRLIATQPPDPRVFTADMVAGLPDPARRYFSFAIEEGTPLYTVAVIEMRGRFGLGTKAAPNYLDMRATQVLAAPVGFVWKMSGGSGLLRMSGSDAATWTRFWLAGLAPVARFGGTADHTRSAFGRYVAEAVFWTPAAMLPGPNVTWEAIDDSTARVIMRHDGLAQPVELTVAEDGRPIRVVFPRWSDANPEKVHRLQPFGGLLSDFRQFQGFRVPTHVEAGNHFGTEDYFAFFIAHVSDVKFPPPVGGAD